jgi:hypothetical protein
MSLPARRRLSLPSVPQPGRVVLFALSAVAAIGIGFVAVRPADAETLIRNWGYYYMLALFGAFVWHGLRVGRARAAVWRPWLRAPGWTGAALALASLTVLWVDPYKHKVLFDEYVLQGTAFQMHATKEIGTIIRAYDVQGTWLPIDTFLDKRPYFFTFLLSLVHDLTGYRLVNIYVLNSAFAPVFLGLFYWTVHTLVGRRGPALFAVALLATMPLLGQQATGAGMELHNLTMLTVVLVCSILYLRAPDEDRLALLVLATVLLAQSRYESVIFVVPVALLIAAGWWRAGRVLLPWAAVAAPLLLVPYAWHNRIVAETPLLWQLGEGQSSRFSVDYLRGNLEGAWRFFFNTGPGLPNSWYLSALGAAGVVAILIRAWRRARRPDRAPLPPAVLALAAIGAGIAANVVLLMFYYWSRFDDVVASRFALPACVLLAVLAALWLARLDARPWPATRAAAWGLAVWLAGWGVPATAQRIYTTQNLVMQEIEWEHAELRKRDPSLLFISNKSTIPFVLWRIPTVINGQGRQRGPQIAFHLAAGTFKEVIVAQALRPTEAGGRLGVATEDILPPEFRLEPIAEKRFGARWARLSRLVAIDPPAKPLAGLAP